jgi:hypothetical protein
MCILPRRRPATWRAKQGRPVVARTEDYRQRFTVERSFAELSQLPAAAHPLRTVDWHISRILHRRRPPHLPAPPPSRRGVDQLLRGLRPQGEWWRTNAWMWHERSCKRR